MNLSKLKTARYFKPRKHEYSAEDITRWRSQGWSWTRIGWMYGCDHTTVMYAAKRMGCFGKAQGVNTRKGERKPKPPREWPSDVRFEDARVPRFA